MKSTVMAIFFGITLLVNFAFAQDVIVETNPRNPVKGETFQILFKCQTTKNSDPQITFDAEGFEVLGKQSQGLSSRTVYHQGKITVSRELLVTYEAIAQKAGRINLRNLVVVLDGKRMTQDVVGIQVLEAPLEPKLVFIAAEVPKKNLFVGEGVTVRYHLYTKTNLQAFDIKKFSKVDGFMKRYLQEPDSIQRVTVDGEVYRRSVIYAARLYPERSGKLIVDPMEVSATYGGDPFGAFGFSFGNPSRLKTKLISSEPVEIDVKPLPTEGRPQSFNGLVGRHHFDLKAPQSQLLVNEPLEARLTVSGPGNLENYEAPDLWSIPQLEKFDAKSDLSLRGGDEAIKTFDYTYLGKAPGEVARKEIEFSYFDPNSGRYEVIKKNLPDIIVAGSVANNKTPINENKSKPSAAEPVGNDISQNPEVSPQGFWAKPWFWVAMLGSFVVIGLFIKFSDFLRVRQTTQASWEKELRFLEKNKPTSALLTRVLHSLSADSTKGIETILSDSDLPRESQEYFLKLMNELERSEFATTRPIGDIVIDKKHLRLLRKALKGM